jgi:predicted lactoylglutathione lyase
MSTPEAILSLLTLGVSDLKRSVTFYESLGFVRKAKGAGGVGFFKAGAMAFAVWSADELAKDANADAGDVSSFRGVALAWNCRSQEEVDAVIARARSAGAKVQKPPQETFWGGYNGYFTDPDGHLWEVAHNPHWPLSEDGQLMLPD